jgi:tetratricopeptide (TPR) repeat protein
MSSVSPAPTPASTRATGARRHLPALAVAIAVVATYSNGLGNGFVWDDQKIVVENAENLDPAGLGRVLTSPDVVLKSQPAPYYRPLTRATFVLDRLAWGLDPLPYHLENLALHLLAALALLALARRVAPDPGAALLAALLFAVHPVNAESVDFVVARNNAMVALFMILACIAWMEARASGRRLPLAASAGLFLLALLSKETGMMLLPFLAAMELAGPVREGEALRARLLRLAPFAGVAGIYLLARVLVLSTVLGAGAAGAGMGAAIVRVAHAVPRYLALVLFPAPLTIYHPDPETFLPGLPALAAAWALLGAVVSLLVRQRRPATRFGLLWFAVNLLPVSGLVAIPSAPIAERFLYVPAIGLWIVAGDQVAALSARVRRRGAIAAACLALLVALALATVRRNRDWKDDLALFSAAARTDPRSTEAAFSLGVALDARGDAEGGRIQWERTLRLDPAHAGALSRLGTWYAERGALDVAAGFFQRAVASEPCNVETRFNLGLLLDRLGRSDEAVAQYRAFLECNPVDYPELAGRVRARIGASGRDAPP